MSKFFPQFSRFDDLYASLMNKSIREELMKELKKLFHHLSYVSQNEDFGEYEKNNGYHQIEFVKVVDNLSAYEFFIDFKWDETNPDELYACLRFCRVHFIDGKGASSRHLTHLPEFIFFVDKNPNKEGKSIKVFPTISEALFYMVHSASQYFEEKYLPIKAEYEAFSALLDQQLENTV